MWVDEQNKDFNCAQVIKFPQEKKEILFGRNKYYKMMWYFVYLPIRSKLWCKITAKRKKTKHETSAN